MQDDGRLSNDSKESGLRIISPVFRYARRDIVITETKADRQAWYRSTGHNSGKPGSWFPFDEITHNSLHLNWFNKWDYTAKFPKGDPLHRLGSKENAATSCRLGSINILVGTEVQNGEHLNAILDFFGAKRTSTYPAIASRPTPDFR